MTSTAYIVERYVCPTIGAILSNLAFSAPVSSLRAAVKAGTLADLNPTPWAFMLGNTLGWLAYSFVAGDLFVFFANVFGVPISVYLNVGAMKLQYYEEVVSAIRTAGAAGDAAAPGGGEGASGSTESETRSAKRDRELPSFTSHEIKVLFVVVAWILILSVASLASATKERMENVVGISVNINLMLFYGAPLSTISAVIRTKSSSTIHFWTMTMNTCNAFFWCVYAFAVQDYYILLPNGIGFAFGIIQVLLYCIFPRAVVVSADGTEQFLSDDDEREPESEII